jgi:hypothetical protein
MLLIFVYYNIYEYNSGMLEIVSRFFKYGVSETECISVIMHNREVLLLSWSHRNEVVSIIGLG